MTATELILRDPLGERALTAADFPVSLGGPGHTVVLPGAAPGTLAWIALHDGQLFLQPVEGREAPLCNGAPVTRPTWLREGDVVDAARGRVRVGARGGVRVLDVEDGSGGNLTVPPEAPLVPIVTGAGDESDEQIASVAFRRADDARATRGPRRTQVIVALGMALLALVAWFLLAGRPVTIESQPAASSIDLRGGLALRVGARFFALPGDYQVALAEPGYATLRAPVTVADAPNQVFRFRLQKLPGRLSVQSPVAARVSVDGRDLGRAPGEFTLAPGKHEVVVSAPRHLPYAAPVVIAGGGQLQTLVARPVPAWALGDGQHGAGGRAGARGRQAARHDAGEPRP